MTLTEKFTDEIIKKFKSLPIKKQFEMREEECMGINIEDYVYEDYSYVLWLAYKLDIKKGEVNIFCEKCDDEVENVDINTETSEWTCPNCGNVDNQ